MTTSEVLSGDNSSAAGLKQDETKKARRLPGLGLSGLQMIS